VANIVRVARHEAVKKLWREQNLDWRTCDKEGAICSHRSIRKARYVTVGGAFCTDIPGLPTLPRTTTPAPLAAVDLPSHDFYINKTKRRVLSSSSRPSPSLSWLCLSRRCKHQRLCQASTDDINRELLRARTGHFYMGWACIGKLELQPATKGPKI
jgi:hypothetical protein